jgi:hypothetical protein
MPDALVLEHAQEFDRIHYEPRGGASSINDIEVDADICWTRHARGSGVTTRCIAIGVRALHLGNVCIVTPNRPVEWIVADRRGNDWTVRQHPPARPSR